MRKKFHCISFLLFLTCLPGFILGQNSFDNFLTRELNSSFYDKASLGISICDLKTGQFLGGVNQKKWMVPASSLKVLTTFVALSELTGDFQFKTRIVVDGQLDHHGVLAGNIIIKGSGDPSLGSNRLNGITSLDNFLLKAVEAIKRAGIKEVEGDVIADYSIFSDDPIPPTWQWDDLGNYYGCGAWGINVLENTYYLAFDRNKKIGQSASYLYLDPYLPGFDITNHIVVDSAGSGDRANIFSTPYASHAMITGTIPQGRSVFKIRGSIPNPPFYLAFRLRQALEKEGIHSRQIQTTREAIPEDKFVLLDSYVSPPLKDLIRDAIHGSINMYCEVFLKTLGINSLEEGTRKAGIRVVEKFMQNAGIATTEFRLEDGSGLSARNQISPYALSRFLCVADSLHGTEVLQDLLAEAGKEGTLASLLKDSPIRQRVWGKTGSMTGIYSLTGICFTQSGRWVSFSLILNGSPEKSSANRLKLEKILEGIYNFF